jgi:type IV pilus assembly protein PilQ
VFVLVTAGACTVKPNKPAQVASTPPAAEAVESPATEQPPSSPSAVQPAPSSTDRPIPPVYSGPLRLHEIRLIETAGQRSILFRFSRPPEGIDYFPLRAPSRLVIDVKGPIEPLAKIHSYKAVDASVSTVRVGTYQGRLRLVVDLKAATVPQFSVDSYETLLTAFIGEKSSDSRVQSNAQVLFVSEEGRNTRFAEAISAPDKSAALPAQQSAPVPAESSVAEQRQTASTPLPEETLSPAPASPEQSASPTTPQPASEPPAVQEKAPVEIAQAAPAVETAPEERKQPGRTQQREPKEDTLPSMTAGGGTGEFRSTSAPQYTGRKISLDFKNADVHDVLRILADVSGLNIVATDDVKARVTLRLIEVPWDQALDVVLQANGLEKSQAGNVITISTTKRLETERTARLAAQNAQRKLAPLETVYVKINYVKATDVVAILSREAEQIAGPGGVPAPPAIGGAPGGRTQVAIMSPRGTVAADPTTNVVIIRDVAERITAIRELIKNVDVQTPQVVIESYIVTANEDLNRDLGIQWGYTYIASPETGNPTGVNFPGRIGLGGSGLGTGGTVANPIPFIADFPAATSAGAGSALDLVLGSLSGSQSLTLRLSALEREGRARIVSRPRVVTLNNKVAQIESRRVIRVPVISDTLNVGGAGANQGGGNAFQQFDVGITLKITPQISSDGFVLLDVDAESSELTPFASVTPSAPSAFIPTIPDTLSRTASSNVLIRAGDTFVLGGILQDNMRQSDTGTPFLKNTPGLSWLFKRDQKSRVKDELLVFITPRLVPGTSTAGLPTAGQLWENRQKGEEPLQSGAAMTDK